MNNPPPKRPHIKARFDSDTDARRRSRQKRRSTSRSVRSERVVDGTVIEARGNRPESVASENARPDRLAAAQTRFFYWIAFGLPLVVWSYWPTLVELVATWNRESDYSHGFLVAPLSIFFLWVKRDRFPIRRIQTGWWGISLIAVSMAMRWASARFYLGSLDGWSLIVCLIGWTWLAGGRHVVTWALPALLFLLFMVPLPYRFENLASIPLQRIATELSCFLLQLLGQPAFAENTTILIGDLPLEVEQACSGLRIFMGILALAVATLMWIEREWWQRALLLVSVVPIALLANATRIVITGLLYRHISSEAARHFSHDLAGWLMIPLAAGLFLCSLWYLARLVVRVESGSAVERRPRSAHSSAN